MNRNEKKARKEIIVVESGSKPDGTGDSFCCLVSMFPIMS